MNGFYISSNAFSEFIDMIMSFFFFWTTDVMGYINWFLNVVVYNAFYTLLEMFTFKDLLYFQPGWWLSYIHDKCLFEDYKRKLNLTVPYILILSFFRSVLICDPSIVEFIVLSFYLFSLFLHMETLVDQAPIGHSVQIQMPLLRLKISEMGPF